MGNANKVKVKVLRLLDTARRGLQETASPAQAIKMLITDDESKTSPRLRIARMFSSTRSPLTLVLAALRESFLMCC
jgi:hypothetical protein